MSAPRAAAAPAGADLEIRPLDRSHGAALLELARACPIEADFTFLFARDPDFFAWPDAVFAGYQVRGVFHDGRLVAAGMAATVRGVSGYGRDLYSYGGDLRVLPEMRGRGLATAIVKDFISHQPPEPDAGFVLVKEGNLAGKSVLDLGGGRGTLPSRPLCGVTAMNVPLLRRVRGPGACRVRRADERDAEPVAALLGRVLAGRPFAPLASAESLAADAARVPGLGFDRYYLAEQGGRLVGALAAWDQGPMRRTVILRYSALGHLERAAFFAGGRLFGTGATLPRPGEALRNLTIARMAVEGDDPAVLADLLAAVTADHAGRGYHLMTVGFPDGDPLRAALKGFLAQPFRSYMYALPVKSFDLPPLPPGMRRPYVEFALI